MNEPYSAADGLVRVYPSRSGGTGLVWVHGGGFAAGDLDMPEAHWVSLQLAARGITVVSVNYRLAPTPEVGAEALGVPTSAGDHYPAGSDDVMEAFHWASSSGLAHRWAIGGASAGANLATGAVLRLVEELGPVPSLVLLAYPTLLALQPEPEASLRSALDAAPEADVFGRDVVLRMYENFLGGPVDDAPLAAVPGQATSDELVDFPSTLIVNSEVDELRVSGELFGSALAAAGCDVTVVVEPGTSHGHLNRANEPASFSTIDRFTRWLARFSSFDD